jgi:hypothetical protein
MHWDAFRVGLDTYQKKLLMIEGLYSGLAAKSDKKTLFVFYFT